ncbi:GNAT family N-acetyltransferase, partial [Burkholderia pseudomallei]|uniref:GNAT family N-acetyltransferase n=1 Tax=Burkholderia pseudomallei TaxID=28450 RepID=UPI00351BEF17
RAAVPARAGRAGGGGRAAGGGGGATSLHRALGFEPIGTLRGVGFKHGRWIDTALMQRVLGDGAQTPPSNADASH